MRKLSIGLLAILSLTVIQSAFAAKVLGPPVEDLLSKPDRTRIVVAEARAKTDDGKIDFVVSERLSGEAPNEIVLRTDEDTFSELVVGNSYVVAWTYLRKNRRFREGYEEDPEGPSTVTIMALGTPAVFEATPEVKYLFSSGTAADETTASGQIDAILRQVQRDDLRSRSLVAAEFYLRPDLAGKMSDEQVAVLRQVLESSELNPQHRELLLSAALRLPSERTANWLGEELRRIIIRYGTHYDLYSFVPNLVRTAAIGLRQAGDASDVELLGLLLYANHPGVSKAAIKSLHHIDNATARDRAQQALSRGWIHAETRNTLTQFLAIQES